MVPSPNTALKQRKRIALVIPCYNEAKRLNLEAYLAFLETHPDVTFCFVNDGSRDATSELLKTFQSAHPTHTIRIVDLPENQGKGEAVRQGVLAVLAEQSLTADLVGFWDSDLATPLAELDRFVEAFTQAPRLQAVVGFRKKEPAANIKRSPSRKLISAIMRVIIRTLIGLPIHDTQCGAKVFKADLAATIFNKPFIGRWLFDLELFLRMKQANGPDFLTQNLEQLHLKSWHDVPGTKLRFWDAFEIFLELAKIKLQYRSR
jgi:glycosyltransferase involved in cell wall biosynthesis